MLNIDRVAGGARNVTLHITGTLMNGDLRLTPIDLVDKEIKIMSLVWLIQEKLGLYLSWNAKWPLLPMESRNSVRFDRGLRPPPDWDGKLWLQSFNFSVAPLGEKWFFVVIDLDR